MSFSDLAFMDFCEFVTIMSIYYIVVFPFYLKGDCNGNPV